MLTQPEPIAEPRHYDVSLIGETNLDLILYGLPADLPLEREVLASDFALTLGGSTSILAHNLSCLGSSVGFSSMVGGDDMGRIAQSRLAAAGLDTSHVIESAAHATGVTLLLPHGKQRHILTYPGTMAELTIDHLDKTFVSSSRHLHLSSLFLQTGLHKGLLSLVDELKQGGMTFSLDTNDDPADEWAGILPELLERVDILLPNEDEVKRMTHSNSVEEALDRLVGRVPIVVVKCGSRGALVQRAADRVWVEPVAVAPVDTIGAGDSFDAGFLHAWLRGAGIAAAASFGNSTGAFSTLRPGGTEAFLDKDLFAQHFGSNSHTVLGGLL